MNLRRQGGTRQKRRAAYSDLVSLRYVANALIVGGSTVALTLLLAGIPVSRETTAALMFLGAMLLAPVALLRLRIGAFRGDSRTWIGWISELLPGIGFLVIGVLISAGRGEKYPVRPYTQGWWGLIGFGLIAGGLGAFTRWSAELATESLGLPDKSTELEDEPPREE